MRAQFWQLYKKEIRESSTLSVAYGVLSLGWFIFLIVMQDWWTLELVFGLAFIPLGLLPFFAMAQGYFSFRGEWKSDCIYSILALPLPGWYFSASKLLASMTVFTALSLLSMAGVFLVGHVYVDLLLTSIPSSIGLGWFWKAVILVYLFYWFMSALVYIVSQFSYLVSRLVNRFTGLVAGLTTLVSYWFLVRVSGWIGLLLSWFPKLRFEVWNNVNGIYNTEVVLIPVAPWIGLALLGVGLGYVGSWILEHILEV